MNRFNLTFSGEILSGKSPAEVKARFGELFGIDDPKRIESFFSGQTVVLRRNLERKAAADFYQKLHKLGLVTALVKVTASDATQAITGTTPSPTGGGETPPQGQTGSEQKNEGTEATDDAGQIWAVSSRTRPKITSEKAPRQGATSAPRPARETPERSTTAEDASQRAQRRALAQRKQAERAVALAAERAEKEIARQEAELAEQKLMAERAAASKAADEEKRRRQQQEAAQQREAEEKARRETELAEKRRQAEQETARQQVEQAEKKRLAEEEAARKAAEEDKRRREQHQAKKQREAEEKARREAEQAEKRRLAEQEAARLQAERAEKKRLAEEEAARKAAEEERHRREQQEAKKQRDAEKKARREAEQAERRRLAEQEAARLQAERAEKKRIAEEEAARKKAEAKKLAAEETARRKAERERQKAERAQQKAEEAARRAAEKAEKKRLADEQAARLEAERLERLRREEEEAARQAVLIAAAEQKAAEEATQREAREKAQRQAELEEKQQREAEEAARAQAELERNKRREAEQEAARLKAEFEDIRRREAEEAARREAEEAARLQAQLAENQRQAGAREQAASETRADHQAPPDETAAQASPRPAGKAKVKTILEVPQRQTGGGKAEELPVLRKRQAGEPNLYQLHAFRNTPEVRERGTVAERGARKALSIGGLALAALLLVAGSFSRLPAESGIAGASAIGINLQPAPVLSAGDRLLLHDRAGVGKHEVPLQEFGVPTLLPPLQFDSNEHFWAIGQLASQAQENALAAPAQLIQCSLPDRQCAAFSADLHDVRVSTFIVNTIDGSVLIADASNGELLKTDAQGTIVARAQVAVPPHPVLRLHSGLLFMNSASAPAISVFRYDDKAFGEQLDEVLLLPPGAVEKERTRAGDFIFSGNNWWVSLSNPDTGSVGLYRFDTQWNLLGEAALENYFGNIQLASWGNKLLVNSGKSAAIRRFNAQGEVEVPLESELLQQLLEQQQSQRQLVAVAWRSVLVLLTLTTIMGLGLGWLQHVRALVYKSGRANGAAPIDEYVNDIRWLDPVANRDAMLRRRSISYAVLVIAMVLLGIGHGISALQLAALLVALSGPAIALAVTGTRAIGHIGVLANRLLLVDHNGIYHLGSRSRVQYRGAFLAIDDVTVFSGNYFLPAFESEQVKSLIRPLAADGVKIDRKTVLTKILQCRHPLAQGCMAILATSCSAVGLLFMQGIF